VSSFFSFEKAQCDGIFYSGGKERTNKEHTHTPNHSFLVNQVIPDRFINNRKSRLYLDQKSRSYNINAFSKKTSTDIKKHIL
jgi:hypothetical protein